MKIVINPDYEHLRTWLENIPHIFDAQGVLLHQQRNTVKKFDLNDALSLNVKRFKKPHIINRFIYTFLRRSKACRSFRNTFEIAQRGFYTADAVAFIEMKRSALLCDSYFVSVQLNDVHEIRDCYYALTDANRPQLEKFAAYSAALHLAGVYHPDYSPGNILISNQEPTTFCLIDLNRVKFGKVSFKKGCSNFQRLFIDNAIYQLIAGIYAARRNRKADEEKVADYMIECKDRYVKRRELKNKKNA